MIATPLLTLRHQRTEFCLRAIVLPMRQPFRISHGVYPTRTNLFVRLAKDGLIGRGEAPVVPYYGDTEDGLIRAVADQAERLPHWLDGNVSGLPPAIAAAVEAAGLDLLGRERGLSLGRLLEVADTPAPPTSFTLAATDVDVMAREVRRAPAGILKIKVGFSGDVAAVRKIRRRSPDAVIRLDANQGWTSEQAISSLEELADIGIELVEEPIRGSWEEIQSIAVASPIPIILDETVRDAAQLEKVRDAAPAVAGLVIKIAKMGGPRPALRILERARNLGLRVMVGSMVESSLGATTAAHLASAADWTDLDTPLLLARDPFRGIRYGEESVLLPDSCGIGADPVPGGDGDF